MRTKWKLAALAFLAIAALLILVAPLATVEIKVDVPSASAANSGDIIVEVPTWITSTIAIVFALMVLGVLAWVARHILRRPRAPDA